MEKQSNEDAQLLSDMATALKGVNWHELGTHLCVPQDKLDAIQQEHSNIPRRLIQVLSYQLNNGELSWEKITEVLKKIGGHANIIASIESEYITPGPQATAISAVSNTQLETDDMHMDTVATSTGTENEGALNRATGNQQVVTEMVEDMDIDQIPSDFNGSKQVKIGNEIHSLDVVPATESSIVAEAKDVLNGAADFKKFVDDLGHAGALIHFAYQRIMAVGPRYTELQLEIEQLGINIAKLGSESARIFSKFKMESAVVLSNLHDAYGYLLHNYANLAIDTLSCVLESAGKMEEDALELHSKFEKEEKEVANTCKKAASHIEKELQCKQHTLKEAKRLEQEAPEEALHQTRTLTKELSVIMMQTALFWKQIHDYCKSLIEERVNLMVTQIKSTKEEADRIKTWTSYPFKESAIHLYASGVALNTVCSEYAEHIKKTQQQLHIYIEESPTYDEARRNIHELAETFHADLRTYYGPGSS